MRDNKWLENRLNHIWQTYFPDVDRMNDVRIAFGKRAVTRLGSIKQVQSRSFSLRSAIGHQPSTITITGYFKEESVPEYVVDLVIAHELCHYAHGFCSPHPQLFENPHQGKIIDKELYKRGFGEEIKNQKFWLKNEWPLIVKSKERMVKRRAKRTSPYKSLIRILLNP